MAAAGPGEVQSRLDPGLAIVDGTRVSISPKSQLEMLQGCDMLSQSVATPAILQR